MQLNIEEIFDWNQQQLSWAQLVVNRTRQEFSLITKSHRFTSRDVIGIWFIAALIKGMQINDFIVTARDFLFHISRIIMEGIFRYERRKRR